MTSWSDLHDCRSTVPFESICVYCCMARLWSDVDAPDASIMSLNARPICVAEPRSPVSGASCCTTPVIESSDVGRPSMRELMVDMEVAASSAEYPRFCITFG